MAHQRARQIWDVEIRCEAKERVGKRVLYSETQVPGTLKVPGTSNSGWQQYIWRSAPIQIVNQERIMSKASKR